MSSEWQTVELHEIADVSSGRAASYRPNDFTGRFPVYGANGPIGSHHASNFGPGYTVGRVGAAGYVTTITERVWASDNALTVTPKNSTDSQYMGHLLRFLDPRKLTTTTAQPLVTQTQLAKLKAHVPPLHEQRRIAEILDTLDRTIDGTQQVIAKLQATRQGLLQDLLTRGLDENGRLRDPKQNPEQFKETELGRVPREWKAGLLKEFADVKGGKRFPAGHSYAANKTEYAYLRVTDFFEKHIRISELSSINRATFTILRHYEIKSGEACISIAGSIGKCAAFPAESDRRVVLTENAARLIPQLEVSAKFLALLINSPRIQSQIALAIGTGGGVPKLAIFRIEQLQVLVPVLAEQERILSKLDGFEERISSEQAQLDKLRNLKRGLMEGLLTGRVRVPVPETRA